MITFVLLLLAYTLSQFYRAFLAIVAADLTRDLGLDAARLGELSAIWFASFALAQFPVGVSLDRWGARVTIGGFMLAATLGAGLFASATSFAGLLAGMAFIGIGCAPVLMGSLYVFGRAYPPERFAMLASVMIGIGSVGNLLGAAPLAMAAAAFGWRASMGAIAAVTFAVTALVFVFLRDPPRPESEASATPAPYSSLLAPGPLWLMLPLVLVSYAFVVALRGLWIAPYFSQVHAFDALARGNAALAMAAAMSAGALLYGPFERWMGSPRRTVIAGSIVTSLALLSLAVPGLGAAPAIALYALVGFAGMTYGILMAHARRFFAPNLLGRGVTLLNFFFIGGAGVVQWLSGRFIQGATEAGWTAGGSFSALHLAFGTMLLAATLLYVLSPEAPPKRSPG